jgi:hydrogenase/urease accessory protein HupE
MRTLGVRLGRVLAAVCVAFAVGLAGPALGHEMTMAEMQLREVAPGQFLWQWTFTSERRPAENDLRPVWPEGCASEQNVLRCGASGLAGELRVEGVGERYSAALVRILWRDGQERVYTLTAAQPTVRLYGSADDKRGAGEVASAYLVLGVEHILTGFDHLLFVVSLLFLVGFTRQLVWTITAFTVAHSLTLASAAMGWLVLRPPPVEACIALSIVLVAGEALHRRKTLARQWPALVAFMFGLVHGLGFAGALKEIGLPEAHLPAALFTFNVGVELGQLFTVGVCWLVWRATARWPLATRLRIAMLYGIGTTAAYWSWLRIAAIAG